MVQYININYKIIKFAIVVYGVAPFEFTIHILVLIIFLYIVKHVYLIVHVQYHSYMVFIHNITHLFYFLFILFYFISYFIQTII